MDQVHFLNLEYIVLRLGTVFSGVIAFFYGTSHTTVNSSGIEITTQSDGLLTQSSSHLISTFTFWGQQFAILGLALSVIMLAICFWLRIKLELYEHGEFHKRDARYHGHDGHGGGHGGHDAHTSHDPVDDADVPLALIPILGLQETFLTPHPKHSASAENSRWQHVLELSNSTHESDWRRAIIEADIMLGDMLGEQGYRGSSIGDKLKDANPLQFTTLDLAWKAHKVRNDIAHGGENFHLSERDVRATIDQYQRVFEEFKLI
jgi:hypothetical protein